MLWSIITFPFRLVGTIVGMVFGFIGSLFSFLMSLVGGAIGLVFGGLFTILFVIGAIVVIRWFIRGIRGV